jgi:hypothetical protein
MKNNKDKVSKPKKNLNIKSKANGLYSLAIALAELVTAYIFVTQDNKILWVLAGVFGLDAAQRLVSKFVK